MREPNDKSSNASDGNIVGSEASASKVSEWNLAAEFPTEVDPTVRPILALLRLGPDAVIDQLCEGSPRNFMEECARHVADNAYFIEEGRLAARVIATLASYAAHPHLPGHHSDEVAERIPTLVEEATAAVLEEGALDGDLSAAPDPIIRRIEVVLGTDERHARGLLDALNALEFTDRHVLFHCIVNGLSPEDYAKKFHDDPRIVSIMLRDAAKLALDEGANGTS